MNVSLEINSLLSVHVTVVLYIDTCERTVLIHDGSGVGYPDDMKCGVNGTVVEYMNLTMCVGLAVFMEHPLVVSTTAFLKVKAFKVSRLIYFKENVTTITRVNM